jgi:hypothetical protein
MEEAVFKRPISLFRPERVRKPEIGDPRLRKQVLGRFGGRFSTRTKTADKTGWCPLPKRVAGLFGTRFRIFVYPFSGPF